jgi:NADPH:quinone reductase
MRAIQVSSYVSSPTDLRVTTLPTPQASPDKYLIRIHAAGTNFFDLLQIRGKYQHQPPLPWISGAEFAGTILSTPTSSSPNSSRPLRFKAGDRVFGASQGAYATYILAKEDTLLPIPDSWSFEDAAGLYVTAPTAYGALVTRAHTQLGEWVLIHAGAGGVGLSAVQVAKALGATVIATAGTERKRQVCLEYGADHVINYRDPRWTDNVLDICRRERSGNGKQGVDIVYDPVGMIAASLKCVAWNARLLVIGFAGGNIEKVAMNRILLKNVSVVGLHWGMYASKEVATVHDVWEGIFRLIGERKFRGIAYRDQNFDGLQSVPAALKALGGRETWGKVVVSLGEDEAEVGGTKSKL